MELTENWTTDQECEIDASLQSLCRLLEGHGVLGISAYEDQGSGMMDIEFEGNASMRKVKELGLMIQEALGVRVFWCALYPQQIVYRIGAKVERSVGLDELLDYELEQIGGDFTELESIRIEYRQSELY